MAIPLWSVAVPFEEDVKQKVEPHIRYPDSPKSVSASAVVIMQFIVDTTGRVDPSSISDIWPADRPRLTGELGEYYRDFVIAVRAGLSSARYVPARVGGCPLRKMVTQPFHFGMR